MEFVVIRTLDALETAPWSQEALVFPPMTQMVVDEIVAKIFEPRHYGPASDRFLLFCPGGRVEQIACDQASLDARTKNTFGGEEYHEVMLPNGDTIYLCIVPWEHDSTVPLVISRTYDSLPVWVINELSTSVVTLGRWQKANNMAGAPSF